MDTKDIKVEYTDAAHEKLQELINETHDWLAPENTIGDYFTVLMEKYIEEFIPEEIRSISWKDLEKPENLKLVNQWFSESELFDVFVKLGSGVI